MSIQTRIAPTPSGFLHIGNAFSFLLTRQIADLYGGEVRLRIDDIDAERSRPEYVQDIFETLSFLDIAFTKGPKMPADFQENFSQQKRLHRYRQMLDQLEKTGLLYGCSCSRKDLLTLQAKGQKRCDCFAKKTSNNTNGVALKIHVPDDVVVPIVDTLQGEVNIRLADAMGDFVLCRKDGIPAYQIASLADDTDYGINYIVRGKDLLASTAAQLFLAGLLEETQFLKIRFLHHPLLQDSKGEKLSKSTGSSSIRSMRQSGMNRDQIIEQVQPGIDSIIQAL